MKKKKVEYLCNGARFWYVKSLDLADFKYVFIYLRDLSKGFIFSGNIALQKHLKTTKKAF